MPATTETMTHRVGYGWERYDDYSTLAEAMEAAEALAATPQPNPIFRWVTVFDMQSSSPLREYERPAS